MRRTRARVSAVRLCSALLAAGVLACAGSEQVGELRGGGDLRERAESFGDNLRWGRFERAAALVLPQARFDYWQRVSAIEQRVRFTGFELVDVVQSGSRDAAEVIASFSLYRVPSVEEETLIVRQRWEYDRASGAWFVEPIASLDPLAPTPPGTRPGR